MSLTKGWYNTIPIKKPWYNYNVYIHLYTDTVLSAQGDSPPSSISMSI